MQSYSTLALALFVALAVISSTQSSAEAATVKLDFLVEEWVVDFFNPTNYKKRPNDRKTPFNIAEDKRKGAILVNGQYPGPTVEVFENDWVEINVINGMISESTSIHWHGVHPVVSGEEKRKRREELRSCTSIHATHDDTSGPTLDRWRRWS